MREVWESIEQLLLHHGRLIANIEGNGTGPAFAFSAGIHGNEPSGVMALKNVFNQISQHNIPVNGKLIAFIGNRNALHNKKRYSHTDLNRMWTNDNITKLHTAGFLPQELTPEIIEMIEIDNLLQQFMEGINGREKYFIDLHTTSSASVPFAAVDQQPESYNLAIRLPIPFISNLDKFLKGTLINYLDHMQFKALVFEAGLHDDPESVLKHEALIWLVLGLSGAIDLADIPNYEGCYTLLQGLSEHPHKVFKILHRHEVRDNMSFRMVPGFINFQRVKSGEQIAFENDIPVYAKYNGKIFMPLYQIQGSDGFFIIEKISKE